MNKSEFLTTYNTICDLHEFLIEAIVNDCDKVMFEVSSNNTIKTCIGYWLEDQNLDYEFGEDYAIVTLKKR